MLDRKTTTRDANHIILYGGMSLRTTTLTNIQFASARILYKFHEKGFNYEVFDLTEVFKFIIRVFCSPVLCI